MMHILSLKMKHEGSLWPTYFTLLSMGSSTVTSVIIGDMMWTLISVFGAVVVLVPPIFAGGRHFHSNIIAMVSVPFLVYSVVSVMHILDPIERYRLVTLLIQTFACMVCGYVMMINVDLNSDSEISKRWLLIFSLTFACLFTVIYAFVLFIPMIEMGYPMYNSDYADGILDNTEANRYQMLPMFITILASPVYASIMRAYLKNMTREEIIRYYGGKD